MIASANDYDSAGDEFYTTFDGGQTWVTGDMLVAGRHADRERSRHGDRPTHEHGHHFPRTTSSRTRASRRTATSWYRSRVTAACIGEAGHRVSRARGRQRSRPGVQRQAVGLHRHQPGFAHYGRTYLYVVAVPRAQRGVCRVADLGVALDYGGQTWSKANEISGSSRTCTFQEAGAALQCDEDQGSVITTTADGTGYVAFENEQHEAAWEPGEQFESRELGGSLDRRWHDV